MVTHQNEISLQNIYHSIKETFSLENYEMFSIEKVASGLPFYNKLSKLIFYLTFLR